ncbi:hypothetical protein BJ912DRAFT_1057053 [Pholiota molesta]|nr:hypothetical protein BJ912DRAFT_1057053 [Pholiota molesta]
MPLTTSPPPPFLAHHRAPCAPPSVEDVGRRETAAPRTTRHHAHRRQPPTARATTRSPRHPTQQPTERPRLATHHKARHPIAHYEVPPPRVGEQAPQKREGGAAAEGEGGLARGDGGFEGSAATGASRRALETELLLLDLRRRAYPYGDAQGGSSDVTPVELVYCPPHRLELVDKRARWRPTVHERAGRWWASEAGRRNLMGFGGHRRHPSTRSKETRGFAEPIQPTTPEAEEEDVYDPDFDIELALSLPRSDGPLPPSDPPSPMSEEEEILLQDPYDKFYAHYERFNDEVSDMWIAFGKHWSAGEGWKPKQPFTLTRFESNFYVYAHDSTNLLNKARRFLQDMTPEDDRWESTLDIIEYCAASHSLLATIRKSCNKMPATSGAI